MNTPARIRTGAKLRRWRRRREITLDAVAIESGVSITFVWKVEKGESAITPKVIAALERLGAPGPLVAAAQASRARKNRRPAP